MTANELTVLVFLLAGGIWLYNWHVWRKRRQARSNAEAGTAEAPALPDLDRALAARAATEATEATKAPAPVPAGHIRPSVSLTAPPLQPARTHTFDALADLDPDVRDLLRALDTCSTPNLSDERTMAAGLAYYVNRACGDTGDACETEVVVKGTQRESGARIDFAFRKRVAVEIKKRDEDGGFTAATIQRAIGQVRKYAGLWPGPVVLVILSKYEPNFDARLKAELASPELAHRPGGPVIAAWKARGQALRIVRPESAVAAALATAPTIH